MIGATIVHGGRASHGLFDAWTARHRRPLDARQALQARAFMRSIQQQVRDHA